MTRPYLRFDRVLLGESLFAFAHVDQGPTVNLLVEGEEIAGGDLFVEEAVAVLIELNGKNKQA